MGSGAEEEKLRYYESAYYVGKYATERRTAAELFPSERHFLDRLIRPGLRILDIGCACGGVYAALDEIGGPVEYTGVDLVAAMIECARSAFPTGHFLRLDAAEGLPFPDEAFDLVLALGVTIHEPRYRLLLRHAYRVTGRHLLYDVHLWDQPLESNDIGSAYVVNATGLRNHYIVTNYADAMLFARSLEPHPRRIELYGYMSPIARGKKVVLPRGPTSVCTAGVLVERGDGVEEPMLVVDLPSSISDAR